MTVTINASTSSGLVQTADGSGIIKVQSNGVTTNALAWCNFDGYTGSGNTINSSYNVSSVTKNATGDYTLNFTNTLSNANYVFSGTCAYGQGSSASTGRYVTAYANGGNPPFGLSTTSLRFNTAYLYNTAFQDAQYIGIVVFGQ